MTLQAFLVGGAVRDSLLGRAAGDRDFVVVGATPEEMTAAGYKPAGADFPVFIHPKTGEEYALARTEKKQGRGHRGFVFYAAPDVELKDDLRRRDLTINAMAKDENGKLIDPFGGQRDLAAKTLRHVSPAFCEDPLRVLRVARFAAMFPNFTVAPDTEKLMQTMTADNALADLSAERIWREIARGLAAVRPSRMFQVLQKCNALAAVLPEVAALDGTPERTDYHPEGDSFLHTMMALEAAADLQLCAEECFAVLLHDIGKAQTPPDILPSHHGHETRGAKLAAALCQRMKAPRRFSDLAILACAEHGNVHNVLEMRPGTVADLLSRLDIFRRPQRAEKVLRVCEADFAYWPARRGATYPQGKFVREAYRATNTVDSAAIAKKESEKYNAAEGNRVAAENEIRGGVAADANRNVANKNRVAAENEKRAVKCESRGAMKCESRGGVAEKIVAQIRQARIKEIRKVRANPIYQAAREKMRIPPKVEGD